MTILELIGGAASRLESAGVAFGHGTTNAYDEAAWLVLWRLGLALDSALEGPGSVAEVSTTPQQQAQVHALVEQRITTRRPAAYLTNEAWLQGVAFYVDQRVIVPRSLIAELLVDGTLDYWLPTDGRKALDLCTGGASLAILAAMAWPELAVDALDISADALAVARLNLERHGLTDRVRLLQGDGLAGARGPVRPDPVQPALRQQRQHGRPAPRVPGRTRVGAGRRHGRHGLRAPAGARGTGLYAARRGFGARSRQRARVFRIRFPGTCRHLA